MSEVPGNTPKFGGLLERLTGLSILCVCAKSLSGLTFCNSMDCSLPGFLCPWDFPGKNTGVRLPFHIPGDLPNPGIKPAFPALQVDSLPLSHLGRPAYSVFTASFSIAK